MALLRRHAHSFGSLSIREKQTRTLAGMREPPVECPYCGTKTPAIDLLAHVETRCSGPRQEQEPQEPKNHWRWVDWRHARAMGVPATTLSFWARTGRVRYLGTRMDRKYLLRDLALKLAQRRGFRRR